MVGIFNLVFIGMIRLDIGRNCSRFQFRNWKGLGASILFGRWEFCNFVPGVLLGNFWMGCSWDWRSIRCSKQVGPHWTDRWAVGALFWHERVELSDKLKMWTPVSIVSDKKIIDWAIKFTLACSSESSLVTYCELFWLLLQPPTTWSRICSNI